MYVRFHNGKQIIVSEVTEIIWTHLKSNNISSYTFFQLDIKLHLCEFNTKCEYYSLINFETRSNSLLPPPPPPPPSPQYTTNWKQVEKFRDSEVTTTGDYPLCYWSLWIRLWKVSVNNTQPNQLYCNLLQYLSRIFYKWGPKFQFHDSLLRMHHAQPLNYSMLWLEVASWLWRYGSKKAIVRQMP